MTALIQARTVYRAGSAGRRLLGAFWRLPFQLLNSPVQWTSEAAADIADQVATEVECQAHYEDSQRPVVGYTASLLSAME